MKHIHTDDDIRKLQLGRAYSQKRILMKSVLLKNDKSLDFTGLEGIFNTAGLFLISKYLKIETFWVKKMCCWRMKKEKNRQ